jgi:hypothetical protein
MGWSINDATAPPPVDSLMSSWKVLGVFAFIAFVRVFCLFLENQLLKTMQERASYDGNAARSAVMPESIAPAAAASATDLVVAPVGARSQTSLVADRVG